MSRNQLHIGAQACHLMFKELRLTKYEHKRRSAYNKTFLLGPTVWNKVVSAGRHGRAGSALDCRAGGWQFKSWHPTSAETHMWGR